MILVSGVLVIDPANLDHATELITTLMAATRTEPGNLEYSFSSVLGDPGRLIISERWEDQAAIDAHSSAPHFVEFMGSAGELGVSHIEINQYEVTNQKKVM